MKWDEARQYSQSIFKYFHYSLRNLFFRICSVHSRAHVTALKDISWYTWILNLSHSLRDGLKIIRHRSTSTTPAVEHHILTDITCNTGLCNL